MVNCLTCLLTAYVLPLPLAVLSHMRHHNVDLWHHEYFQIEISLPKGSSFPSRRPPTSVQSRPSLPCQSHEGPRQTSLAPRTGIAVEGRHQEHSFEGWSLQCATMVIDSADVLFMGPLVCPVPSPQRGELIQNLVASGVALAQPGYPGPGRSHHLAELDSGYSSRSS